MSSSSSIVTRKRFHGVLIQSMAPGDVESADHVMRVSFGTFSGLSNPSSAFGEAQYVRPRYEAEPSWAFVAAYGGDVVGSVFATRRASFGSLGPLTVRPDLWDPGIAHQLMHPIVALSDEWLVRLAGLFTFAQSAKNVRLYQRFDFSPRKLTAIMAKDVGPVASRELELFSDLSEIHRTMALTECAELTDAVYPGLDEGHEVHTVCAQDLGDTVLVLDGSRLVGLAVCHSASPRPAPGNSASHSPRCTRACAHPSTSTSCGSHARSWPRSGARGSSLRA